MSTSGRGCAERQIGTVIPAQTSASRVNAGQHLVSDGFGDPEGTSADLQVKPRIGLRRIEVGSCSAALPIEVSCMPVC